MYQVSQSAGIYECYFFFQARLSFKKSNTKDVNTQKSYLSISAISPCNHYLCDASQVFVSLPQMHGGYIVPEYVIQKSLANTVSSALPLSSVGW